MMLTGLLGTTKSYLAGIELGAGVGSGSSTPPISRTTTNVLTISQSAICNIVHPLSASNTITFIESATENHSFFLLTSNTLSLAQDLVTGIPEHIIQPIVFSQVATGFIVHTKSASNTVVFSHTVSVQHTTNLSPSNTITFSENVHQTQSESPSSTITFAQDAEFLKTFVVAAFNPITFTETTVVHKISARFTTNSFNPVHAVLLHKTLNLTINKPLNFSQQVIVSVSKPATDTIVFGQTVTVEKIKAIKQVLEFSQSVQVQIIYNRSINQLFQPFQMVTDIKKLNLATQNTFFPTQHVTVYNVKSVTQPIVFTQSVIVSASKLAQNIVTFTNSVTTNIVSNQIAPSNLFFDQNVLMNKSKVKRMINRLTFGQQATYKKIHIRSASNVLNLTQELVKVRTFETITQPTTFAQTTSCLHILNRSASNQLHLNSGVIKEAILVRAATNQLVFRNDYVKNFAIGPVHNISVPNIIVTKIPSVGINKKRHTLNWLYSNRASVLLTNAEFGDTIGNKDLCTVRRAMNGALRTYVKTTELQKLKYTFRMRKPKADELKTFLLSNSSELLILENWKGEKWQVYIITNPIEFTDVDRWEPSCVELVETTLELEGFRFH